MTNINSTDIASGAVILVFLIALVAFSLKTRRLKGAYFQTRWDRLEKQCANQKTWYKAIIDADNLLNDALKRNHYKGKSTAERLVAAQRQLSSNHSVWFGHKLRVKIDERELRKISKKDTKTALAGFHKALKDLGAIQTVEKTKAAK